MCVPLEMGGAFGAALGFHRPFTGPRDVSKRGDWLPQLRARVPSRMIEARASGGSVNLRPAADEHREARSSRFLPVPLWILTRIWFFKGPPKGETTFILFYSIYADFCINFVFILNNFKNKNSFK